MKTPSSFGTENSKLWHQKKRCRKKTADSLSCCVRIFTKAVVLASILQAHTCGCHGCSENQVTWRSDDAAQNDTCLHCVDCPDGMEPSIPCGTVAKYGTHLHCVACRVGTYSNNYGKDQCTPCSLCLGGRTVTRNCSATKNTLCGSCSYGYYMNDVVMSCLPCSACCWDGRDQLENNCIAQGLPKHRHCRPRHGDRCQVSTTTKVSTGAIIVITSRTSVQRTSQKGKTILPRISTTKHSRTDSEMQYENTAASLALSTTSRQLPMETIKKSTTSQTTANQLSIETTRKTTSSPSFTKSTVVYGKAGKSLFDNSEDKARVIVTVIFIMVALTLAVVIIKRNTIARYLRWARCRPVCRSKDSELGERTENSIVPEDITEPVAVKAKGDSKLLSSLLNKDTAFQRICEVLDTPVPGGSNYKAVAQHYGFDHYQIASLLENNPNPEGSTRTRALIESLAATCPDLTVEGFATVAEKKTRRNDVVKLLRAYDLAEENNVQN